VERHLRAECRERETSRDVADPLHLAGDIKSSEISNSPCLGPSTPAVNAAKPDH